MKAVIGIWGAVPIALLQDDRISHAALKTYISLASFQGTKEECYPGIEDIAERAGMSERSVKDGLQVLRESDWITSRRRGLGKTNVYRVKMALETQESALQEGQTSALQEGQTSALPLILSSSSLDSSKENTTRKQSPAVAGPFRPLMKSLEELHGSQFVNYPKEGKALKTLLERVTKMYPEGEAPEKIRFMAAFLQSLQGGRDRFWKTVPVVPSSLLCHWDRLYAMAKAKAAEDDWEHMSSPLARKEGEVDERN